MAPIVVNLAVLSVVLAVGISSEQLLAGHGYIELIQHVGRRSATLFALGLLLLGCWRVLVYPNFMSPLRHLPGPKENSLLMGQYFAVRKRRLCEPYRDWFESIPNDGIIRYKFLFNTERLLPTSPDTLREVLLTKAYDYVKPFQLRQALSKIIGRGIILQEHDEHRYLRKHMGAAFTVTRVRNLYPIFWAKAKELGDELAHFITTQDSPVIDVNEWAARATLDIIGIAAMGKDFNCLADPTNHLATCYRDLRNVLLAKTTPSLKLLLSMLLPGADMRLVTRGNDEGLDAGGAYVKAVARQLVRAKMEAQKRQVSAGVDMLGGLVEAGALDEDALVDQAMTLLMAGHETTAASVAWAMYALCRWPEVQDRLRGELMRAFPHGLDDIEAQNVTPEKLPYLWAVCNEVLRLYPPGPRTIRIADRDTTILNQLVPKGTPVIISPWALATSTALWGPDAAEFRPERWLNGEMNGGGASSSYAFLTFLAGPRSCLGVHFARGEFACILLAWVRRFRVAFAEEGYQLEVSTGLTIRPKLGFSVRLTPVEEVKV